MNPIDPNQNMLQIFADVLYEQISQVVTTARVSELEFLIKQLFKVRINTKNEEQKLRK
jgi:hypothetical protein